MVRIGTFSMIAAACLWLSACGEAAQTGPQLALMNEPQVGLDAYSETTGYRLGAGDKMRIIVFGEPDLSGEFFVDDGGSVDLPLIGDVQAGGATVSEFEQKVVARFSDGYLRDPKVSIEVLNYRPFFIIGEVKSGGEYPYKGGLTVQDAVAIAGGYSYRANERVAFIRRANSDQEIKADLAQRVAIFPGDNVRIPERFF
jgi:protein involved in polysaccharide export with SLBB domain